MSKLLCFFVIALSICAYPIILRVPVEITPVFGLIEMDMFSWYRMWLVVLTGILFVDLDNQPLIWFLLLALISAITSTFFRTSIFGAPWTHEGLLAIIGYAGIYQLTQRTGITKDLEKSLDAAVILVFIFCVLQVRYGNFALFPPINRLLPDFVFETQRRPLASTLGSSNHLGLFCALFFPYTLLRYKYKLAGLVLLMAVLSESRGAWLSILVTMSMAGKRYAICTALLAVALSLPFYDRIIPRIIGTKDLIHFPIRDYDLSGRGYMWKRTLQQLPKTIVIGNGPGNYPMYFPQKEKRRNEARFGNLVVDRPHNMYLSIWTGTGLASLAIIMTGIGSVLKHAKDKALQMGCIGFLTAGLFTDSVLCVTPYFVIFLGALSHKREKT